MSKRFAPVVLVLLAVAALALAAVPVGAQASTSALTIDCPGGGSINNGIAIGVNVRPGTYRVTAVGVGGFDPVMALYDVAADATIDCVDDAAAAATYSALLPTTGLIAPSSFNAQLEVTNVTNDFQNFFAVVGGFGDSAGEVVVIFEELAVTSADGSGELAGDPFYIGVTQNLVDSGVPITAYMISLTNVLDPYVSLIYDEAVATIDGVPAICDDAGNPARCYGDPGALTTSYIAYTAPNGDTYNLPGYQFDAALRFDPFVFADAGIDSAEVRFSSFGQSTVGDYVAAFHLGIAPLAGTTPATTGTTTGGSLTGSAGTTTGTTGSLTGAAGSTTGGSLTGSAGSTSAGLPAATLTCLDNAQSTALGGLAEGQSVLVTCPANCSGGAVWGSRIYTDDSSVCVAAIHAGAIGAAGGQAIITILPGQQSYTGSSSNGISTSNWGAWTRSFSAAPVTGASVTPPTPAATTGSLTGSTITTTGAAAPTVTPATTGSLTGGAAGTTTGSLTGSTITTTGSFPAASTVTGELTEVSAGAQYAFTGTAGDLVTLTLSAVNGSFDTVLELYIAGQIQPVSQNDDHGTSTPGLARFDSLIANFTLPSTDQYLVRVRGFAGAVGPYQLTLSVDNRSGSPAEDYTLTAQTIGTTPPTAALTTGASLSGAAQPTAVPTTGASLSGAAQPTAVPTTGASLSGAAQPTPITSTTAGFVPPAFTGTYTTPDGIVVPLPNGYVVRELSTGTIIASSAAALEAASAAPQALVAQFPPDSLAIQIIPQSLTSEMTDADPADVLLAIRPSGIDPIDLPGVGLAAAVMPIEGDDVPPTAAEAYLFAVRYDAGLVVILLASTYPVDETLQVFAEDWFDDISMGGGNTIAEATAAAPTPVPTTAPVITPDGETVLFGAPAEPQIFSAPTTPLDLGAGLSVLMPDGWVLEEFDNRYVLADTPETLQRVVESGSDTTFLEPNMLAVIVFKADFIASITTGPDPLAALELFGVQMDTAVAVDGLGTNAASGVVGVDDLPDGGISFVTAVDFDGDLIVFTAITSYQPGQVSEQVRSLITSVVSAAPTTAPTGGELTPFTATFASGETLTVGLPDGWAANPNEGQGLVNVGTDSDEDEVNEGTAAGDLPPGGYSIQLGTVSALEDLIGSPATDVTSALEAVGAIFDVALDIEPFTGLSGAAAIAAADVPGLSEGLQLIVFQSGDAILLSGFIANDDPAAALDTVRMILNSITYTAAGGEPIAQVTPSSGSTDLPDIALAEPTNFELDDGSLVSIRLPVGWYAESNTRSSDVLIATSEDVLEAVNDGSGASDLPLGAISMSLLTPSEISGLGLGSDLNAEALIDAALTNFNFGGTVSSFPGADIPAFIAFPIGEGVPQGAAIATFETPSGVFLTAFIGNDDDEVIAATVLAIINSITYTAAGGEPIAQATVSSGAAPALTDTVSLELADGSGMSLLIPAGWFAETDGVGSDVLIATSEADLEAVNDGTDASDLPPGAISIALYAANGLGQMELSAADSAEAALNTLLDNLRADNAVLPFPGADFPAFIANLTGEDLPEGATIASFERPDGLLVAAFIGNDDEAVITATVLAIINSITYTPTAALPTPEVNLALTPFTAEFPAGDVITFGLPEGWEAEVYADQGLVTFGDPDHFEAVSASELPDGAFVVQLYTQAALEAFIGGPATSVDQAIDRLGASLDVTLTPTSLPGLSGDAAYAIAQSDGLSDLPFVVFASGDGILMLTYLANTEEAVALATIVNLIQTVVYTPAG